VLGGSRSLRAVVSAVTSSLGAVAVARHSRRRYLRRRAGVLGAGLFVPPRSWRRGAQPERCRSGGSLRRALSRAITQRAAIPVWCQPAAREGTRGVAACGAALALVAPAQSCRRARGGVTLDAALPWRRLALSARVITSYHSGNALSTTPPSNGSPPM